MPRGITVDGGPTLGPKFTISLTEDLETKVSERTRPSVGKASIIRRDLRRLYDLYHRALAETALTLDQARLFVKVVHVHAGDVDQRSEHDARSIHWWASDAIALREVPDADPDTAAALVAKLQSCTSLQCLALLDAAQRYNRKYTADSDAADDIHDALSRFFRIED